MRSLVASFGVCPISLLVCSFSNVLYPAALRTNIPDKFLSHLAMASNMLHAAHDSAGAGTEGSTPNTLRKDSAARSQLGAGSTTSSKGKLVKSRNVSGGDEFSAQPPPPQSPLTNRNRLKKGTGAGAAVALIDSGMCNASSSPYTRRLEKLV